DRIFLVHVLGRRAIIVGVKPGFAVWVMKHTAFEQAWRARMLLRWAWPEESHVLFDPFVGHPAVINRSAFGRRGEFIENLFGAGVLEKFSAAQPLSEIADDVPVNARVARR